MSPLMHRVGGEGPSVVLIHGFGADRLSWVATSPALLDSYAVWAAELPAHGAAQPEPTTPIDMAQALVELLPETDDSATDYSATDDSGAGGPATGGSVALIGHSLGGAVAAHLAALQPSRIGKTVLIAPAGFGQKQGDGQGLGATDFLTRLPELQTEDEALALLRQLVVRERLIMPQMAQYVLKHLAQPGRREALSQIAKAALNFLPPALPEGALVIWGDDDAINPPDVKWLDGLGEQAMRLPQTGHLPHVEAVSQVNRRIAEYLNA